MRQFQFFSPTVPGPGATAPATTPPVTDPAADDPAGGDSSKDLAYWQAEKRKADREAQGLRTRLKALEDADTERKKAEMTDLEKAQAATKALEAEREAARAEARQARAEVAISREAAKAGLPADFAIRLLRGDVTFDDNGQPVDVDKSVADLVKEYPQMVGGGTGAATPTGGTAANPGRARTGATLTKADIEKMSSTEVNARWEEVQAVLKKG